MFDKYITSNKIKNIIHAPLPAKKKNKAMRTINLTN